MERSWREWTPGVLVFLVFLALLMASAPGRDHYLQDDDHGFQLCLGQEVLNGRIPGVDLFNAYGPLVAYASALGQGLSGSLVGETAICVLAWALSLTLVFVLVWRHASIVSALLAALLGYLLLARFYKWYLWLWPLAALLLLDQALDRRAPERGRHLFRLGVVVGLGWLHRVDVGTLTLLATGLVALIFLRRGGLRLLSGFAAPLAVWFAYLVFRGGIDAALYFLRSTLMGGLMAKSGMGTDFPSFDAADPFSGASVRVAAYVLLFLAYGIWFVRGLLDLRRGSGPRSRFLFATACVGLAVVHQSLHRKDGQHLLQVIAPAVVGLFVWGEALLREVLGAGPARLAGRVARSAVLVATLVVLISMTRWGRVDLRSPGLDFSSRYPRLSDPLRAGEKNTLLRPILRMRELTDEGDSVLVFPLWPQAYVFAERRMSGMLHGYYPGVFNTPPWSEDNLKAIQDDAPAVVLVTSDFLGDAGPWGERYARYRAAHPSVDAWVRENYPVVLHDDGRMVLLGPPAAQGGAAAEDPAPTGEGGPR